jgi:hypothetical protein
VTSQTHLVTLAGGGLGKFLPVVRLFSLGSFLNAKEAKTNFRYY